MLTTIVARTDRPDLLEAIDVHLRDGWKIQGGLAYGDGKWAVLLVKEKEEEKPQFPFKTGRTKAYQEVRAK